MAIIEFQKILKRTDAKALLLLSLWPAIFSVATWLSPTIYNYTGKVSAVHFANQQILIHSGALLPLVLIVYMASLSFYQELVEKQIYLYKDIPRAKILKSKYFSLYGTYFLFLISYILMTFLFYFLIFNKTAGATGNFVEHQEELIPMIYDSFQIIIGFLFYMHIGISFALRFSPGVSVFLTLFAYLFIKTMPTISWAKFLTPVGYREIIPFNENSLMYTLIISMTVFMIYNIIFYLLNKRYFLKKDFN